MKHLLIKFTVGFMIMIFMPMVSLAGFGCDPNNCSGFCEVQAGVSGECVDEPVCECVPFEPFGACLVDGECVEVTAEECDDEGGTYQGDGTTCGPDTCPFDCSGAAADPEKLWPPNHEFEEISIVGVTGAVMLNIDSIFQDEPTLGIGEGNTCPDGRGIGTEIPGVRAERSGPGDGRVYHISFSASDGQGGECTGTVRVCVPHDQAPGTVCVDNGPQHNSEDCNGN